jgi:hypothetical protein
MKHVLSPTFFAFFFPSSISVQSTVPYCISRELDIADTWMCSFRGSAAEVTNCFVAVTVHSTKVITGIQN